MSRLLFPLLVAAALAGAGCDDKKAAFSSPEVGAKKPGNAAGAPVPAGDAPPADAGAERKVILNVQMDITVDDIGDAGDRIHQIVRESKGYVVKSEETGRAGLNRRAAWTVRVPARALGPVADALRDLGVVTRRSSDAKDVTDEFYDTEARLKHWKGEEETLVKLMKEKAQTAEDILKFRAQIAGVRENIDRMEGRMNTMRVLTEMSTIDLTLRDRADAPAAPTTSAGRTFAASVQALQDFGHALLIGAVGLAPWLPLILVAVFGLRWAALRVTRPKARRKPPELPAKAAERE